MASEFPLVCKSRFPPKFCVMYSSKVMRALEGGEESVNEAMDIQCVPSVVAGESYRQECGPRQQWLCAPGPDQDGQETVCKDWGWYGEIRQE